MMQPPDAPADATEKPLQAHITCLACGYDLHGLPLAGNCPECAYSVRASVQAGDYDVVWLTAIHSGVQALLVGHYMLLGSIALIITIPLGVCFYVILMLGASVELAVEPAGAPQVHSSWRRKASSSLIGAGMVVVIAAAIVATAFPSGALALAAGGIAVMVVGVVVLFRRLGDLMSRSLSPKAATRSRLAAWLYALAAIPAAAAALLTFSSVSSLLIDQILNWLVIAAAFTWLVAAVLAIVTAHTALTALNRSLAAARARAAAAP